MLHVTATGWAATIGLIAALLALDLIVAARRPPVVSFREAAAWSGFYIGIALLFGLVFGALAGWALAGQYFAGYVVEKSLSVDNLFVFIMILTSLAVPVEQRRRALTIGISLALVLRAIFIALGAALLESFSLMFLVFGIGLILTAVQLFRHRAEDPSIEDNALVGAARRALPISEDYHGDRLVIREGTRRLATPLLLVLIALASTDLLFAFDSIPAVFGVTQHAYIVLCANAFALIGLRSLYFLVSGVLDRLIYLSSGLAVILAFIGAKLILHFAHSHNHNIPEISTGASLVVIVLILVVTVLASAAAVKRDPSRRASAGSVVRSHGRKLTSADPDQPRRSGSSD